MAVCGNSGYEAFGFADLDIHRGVYKIPDGSGQILALDDRTARGWRVVLLTLPCASIEVLRV